LQGVKAERLGRRAVVELGHSQLQLDAVGLPGKLQQLGDLLVGQRRHRGGCRGHRRALLFDPVE
jgi:hypothetical protein